MNRRDFLKWAAASSVFALSPIPGAWAFTSGKESTDNKKLIVILLRGGADGLNVVAPYGDSRYYDLRPRIALSKPGSDNGVLDLDGYFGLHPALAPLMPYWNNKSLAFVHACGSPDPSRSHFDAQDYMESGIPGSKSAPSGWMNRLVSQLPSKHSPVQAISIGPTLPRIFSGPASVATIASTNKPGQIQQQAIDRPIIAKGFEELYGSRQDDLGRAYAEGIAAHKEVNKVLSTPDDAEMASVEADKMEQIAANRGAPVLKRNNPFGKQVSKLFRSDPAVQVAFLDFGGWDTHVNEGTGVGQLANKLTPLATGLVDLIEGLGPLYANTTIMVMSEFGRTAKENGNAGTDHGHGNVMWLLGGEVGGGHVYGRWAGLNNNQLHESRDLPTSTDFRTVVSTILGNQIQLPKQAISNVFPDFQSPGNPFIKA
jgi:uncharacterized protein (DUF1501 family)